MTGTAIAPAVSSGGNLRRFIARYFVPLAAIIVVAALALRLRGLGLADGGYDEGVYLQTLMAMASGHALYREIFYSQPPAFILGVYPFFLLCGQNLWAARLGVAVLSLIALPGAAVVGACVGGRVAALLALALIAFDPLSLAPSRTLEAEAPQIAFSLLAVALALLWARRRSGRAAPVLALLACAAATFSTLCKATGIAAFVPLAIIFAQAAWDRRERGSVAFSSGAALLGVGTTLAAFGLPLLGDLPPLWRQVVEFHLAARAAFGDGAIDHAGIITTFLAAAPESYAALFGAAVGFARREPLALPLLGWFLAAVALLVNQTPLFDHHLATLEPSLVALATLGWSRHHPDALVPTPLRAAQAPPLATILCIAVVAINAAAGTVAHVSGLGRARSASTRNLALARDIARNLDDQDLVITDCPLAAALAPRRTPPALVDTSYVRIGSGYLTAADLIAAAARPDVAMVLFCGHQLDAPQLAPFRQWVAQHFRLQRRGPPGGAGQMWLKPPAPRP